MNEGCREARRRDLFRHWLRFNVVGAFGIAVQMTLLGVLVHGAAMPYLPATAIAVEASVLHNFVWHIRWTWVDRLASGAQTPQTMFWRFHLTSGAMSIAGNLLLMRLLVGEFGMNAIVANAVTIALCAVINFLLSDRYAFA